MNKQELDLDQMCGTCFKRFDDCMCCECGSEDGIQYPEGIMCSECHEELEARELEESEEV